MKRIAWNKGLTKETDKRVKGWNKGLTKETDKRIKSSWNKGLTKETSEKVKQYSTSLIGKSKGKASTLEKENERKRKISNWAKTSGVGGYKKGSGRGKKGRYEGIWCDSSWELAWVIYHLEHNIKFERNTEKFEYIFNNKKYTYIPDFIINNDYIEIKGYITEQVKTKINQFPKKLIVLLQLDMKKYLDYVIQKYGNDFTKLYNKEVSYYMGLKI